MVYRHCVTPCHWWGEGLLTPLLARPENERYFSNIENNALDRATAASQRGQTLATFHGARAYPGANAVGFSKLKVLTNLSDSALSKHLSTLEGAGYITRRREYGSSRAKDTVWVALTNEGRTAYADHIAALRALSTS